MSRPGEVDCEGEGELWDDVADAPGRCGDGEVVRISGTGLSGEPGAVRYSTSRSSDGVPVTSPALHPGNPRGVAWVYRPSVGLDCGGGAGA